MSTPFIGQIQAFAFGIVPRGWLTCSGQLISVNQNQPLFSLIGTIFGGDGSNTFGLPDLRGAFILSPSATYAYGSIGGETNHTLTTAEMPSHNHPMVASTAAAASPAIFASGNFPAVANPGVQNYGSGTDIAYGNGSNSAGGNQPHPNQPPYLVMNYCIALAGIYPSRS